MHSRSACSKAAQFRAEVAPPAACWEEVEAQQSRCVSEICTSTRCSGTKGKTRELESERAEHTEDSRHRPHAGVCFCLFIGAFEAEVLD